MKSKWRVPVLGGGVLLCLAVVWSLRRESGAGRETSAPPSVERERRIAPEDDPQEAIRQIRAAMAKGELADHERAFHELLPGLVRRHPAAAADFAGSLENGPLRDEMMRRVAQYWTERDPVAAQKWAEGLREPHERSSVLSDVCYQLAQQDPKRATLLADEKGLGDFTGGVLENLAQQWAVREPSEALAWVSGREPGEERDQLLSRVALVLAKTAPAEAASLVVKEIPAGEAQSEAVISVLYQWSRSEPREALAWVELFPEGALRERAMNELKGAGAGSR
ncbi:MAG: hypothetical protein JWO82_2135 [Akkermansiaceae bacterium]|nr:hypothetical protein [Akkermansiaceae bacterium]